MDYYITYGGAKENLMIFKTDAYSEIICPKKLHREHPLHDATD